MLSSVPTPTPPSSFLLLVHSHPLNAQHCRFYVAVRLDVANALAVNPRHLQLISMEERADEVVVLQLLLAQPPDSALSLANIGGKLSKQVHPLEKTNIGFNMVSS